MAALIAGRTASEMPGLDIAEQKSWQNFLDSTLRLYATLNRRLTEAHQLIAVRRAGARHAGPRRRAGRRGWAISPRR